MHKIQKAGASFQERSARMNRKEFQSYKGTTASYANIGRSRGKKKNGGATWKGEGRKLEPPKKTAPDLDLPNQYSGTEKYSPGKYSLIERTCESAAVSTVTRRRRGEMGRFTRRDSEEGSGFN